MTANASLVSNRTTTPASAIQARANTQSAAIALLGAGTSTLNQGEGSFADSLESESKRQTAPQSLFSDKDNSARATPRAEKASEVSPRRDDARDTKPAAAADDDSCATPLTKRPRAAKPESQSGDEAPSDSPLTLDDIPTARTPNPIQAPSSTAPIANPAVQQPLAEATVESGENSAEQAKAAAGNQKTRQPTDPLRLITPQQQAASEDAPISAQSTATQTAAQAAGQITNSNESNAKQANIRANQNSNATRSNGQISPANATTTAGIGMPLTTGAVTSTPSGQSSGAVTSITAATGAGGASTGAAPLDQVTPPRTGGGRPIEHPVTLKLKMAPASANNSPQLSEAEITAAETQIGRGLTAAFRQNTPQVTLWMSPETLGKVRIQLTFDQGTIAARFEATSDATKELLSQNMGALRDALQSRGLTATQIEVVSIPDWSQQNNPQSGTNQGSSTNQPPQNQSSAGGNTPSGHGGQQQQETPQHSKGWAALPQGNEISQSPTSADVQISMPIDSRLMTLKAHLELDAVA